MPDTRYTKTPQWPTMHIWEASLLFTEFFVLSNTTCNWQPLISWKGYNFKEKIFYTWKAMKESSVTITNEQIRDDWDEDQDTLCSTTTRE